MIKQALNQITTLTQQIYEHVGYSEGWTFLPLDDCTDHVWALTRGGVEYADSVDDFTETGDYYSNEFYRDAISSVYRGAEFTAIAVDTHCDGNKFLQIFDNTKEITGREHVW